MPEAGFQRQTGVNTVLLPSTTQFSDVAVLANNTHSLCLSLTSSLHAAVLAAVLLIAPKPELHLIPLPHRPFHISLTAHSLHHSSRFTRSLLFSSLCLHLAFTFPSPFLHFALVHLSIPAPYLFRLNSSISPKTNPFLLHHCPSSSYLLLRIQQPPTLLITLLKEQEPLGIT